jgi:nucleoid DNA-binding protein
MGRFPRTVSIEEAFRRILRALYPARPALADEIQSYDWDSFRGHHWWHEETNLTPDEVIAVNKAFELLDQLVVEQGKIRLRGALHPSKPLEDIDPADTSAGKLHVFDGKLRVFDGNKHVKTYYRVHCYETDVDRCVAELRSETKRGKWTSLVGFEKFTAGYKDSLNGKAPPTEAEFTGAANNAGHYRPRKEMRSAWRNAFGPRPRGRRPTKSAEK